MVICIVGVAFAIIQRSIKPYLEERAIAEQAGKTLPFSGAYVTNALLSVLGSVTLVLGAIDQLVSRIGANTSAIVILGIGYTFAYTMIDQLNKRTEKKEEIAALKTPATTPS